MHTRAHASTPGGILQKGTWKYAKNVGKSKKRKWMLHVNSFRSSLQLYTYCWRVKISPEIFFFDLQNICNKMKESQKNALMFHFAATVPPMSPCPTPQLQSMWKLVLKCLLCSSHFSGSRENSAIARKMETQICRKCKKMRFFHKLNCKKKVQIKNLHVPPLYVRNAKKKQCSSTYQRPYTWLTNIVPQAKRSTPASRLAGELGPSAAFALSLCEGCSLCTTLAGAEEKQKTNL